MEHPTSREVAVEPACTTLLFIDVQNYCAVREGGDHGALALIVPPVRP